MPGETVHWPQEIRLQDQGRQLTIQFGPDERFALTAEYLRVMSPSAEVRGHAPEERKVVAGKAAVAISAIEPVGHYAVRLRFDDGHATGLYSWDYLYELGAEAAEKWQQYLTELAAKGLERGVRS
jgi:DUF971 family protein